MGWILYLIVTTDRGVAINTQIFTTELACKHAAMVIQEGVSHSRYVGAVTKCVIKDMR